VVFSDVQIWSNKPLEWTGHHLLSVHHPKLLACHSGAAFGCRRFSARTVSSAG